MDDYYSLLGVDRDASTDEIRTAYRARKSELDAQGTDAAKAEVALVNRAWNLLSDPYQRGRYDEKLASGATVGEAGDDSAEEAMASPAPPARRRLFEPSGRTPPSAPLEPTITLPEGMSLADRRARLRAMGIDLSILIAAFLALFMVIPRWTESRYPAETDRLDQLADEIDAADERRDDAADVLNEAEDSGDQEAIDAARADKEAADDEYDALTEEADDVYGEIAPFQLALFELAFLFALFYLIPSSALSGQTLGKRVARVRVVRADGSRLGWGGAIVRYGMIVLVANMLYLVLRELALVIVLFGVLMWMRNPNQQGIHDRVAKTVVVDA